ncbi:hypothetical protein MO867_16650 [Microbulbifer sp. OS29]|uniref:Uncharacterized protein n=1 Tax=Microbulbifer okhotskensis TaxID=2926617 RepID=A0A9X2EQK4_9GAMM|nr:hypothetical protein [Microbulbifer okhotskensis]MCO1335965.1 hypothetical protein [Microbulbifer okhotskensis]
MKIFLTPVLLTLLSIGANGAEVAEVADHSDKSNLTKNPPLGCVNATSITSINTAADITAGAKVCAEQSKFSEAAELIMVAIAFAYFDTQRVTDKSAHGALSALFEKEFSSIDPLNRKKLFTSINALDKGNERKREICSYLEASEPPTYIPNYMISHGMGSYTNSSKEPIAEDFDASKGWSRSMAFIKCSS